jgi:hypothetical protein
MQMYKTRFQPIRPCSFVPPGASLVAEEEKELMERTNDQAEEKNVAAVPENDGGLSVDDLDTIAGGTISDPCEGGQIRNR